MDSNTVVMPREYTNTNLSEIPLSSSVECIREGTRIDATVKLKPKKNDSLPRLFRRKRTDPTEYCMSTKEELKPDSSRTNSLGRRLQFRISQMRNPPGSPVESLETGAHIETKKGGIRSTISGYWSSIFKKTPREAGEIVQPPKVETITTSLATAESQTTKVTEDVSVPKERIPEVPKLTKGETEELEKAVKSTTQEVYAG